MNKSDSTMGSSGRRDCILKYLVGLLSLVALIFLSSFVYVMNSDPVLELKQCEKRLQNETSMLNECEQARGESQSLLNNCQAQSVALSGNIVTLEKKLKDLELLNTNLNNEQEQLKAAVQKWQQQFNECETNVATTNNHLKRTRQDLNQCQQDKARCRSQLQLCSQASRVNGAHTGWIVLTVVYLISLYG
ncbi:trafficking kinesin-binding protein 1-like [Heptranchias perlo]|uniref:trafficking kinesin-binding protein 1-like n=1 Tax=Heptranchias perlo TaxID=212740 RepID=UPI00355AA9CA